MTGALRGASILAAALLLAGCGGNDFVMGSFETERDRVASEFRSAGGTCSNVASYTNAEGDELRDIRCTVLDGLLVVEVVERTGDDVTDVSVLMTFEIVDAAEQVRPLLERIATAYGYSSAEIRRCEAIAAGAAEDHIMFESVQGERERMCTKFGGLVSVAKVELVAYGVVGRE